MPGGDAGQTPWEGFEGSTEHAEVFHELHRSDPAVAERLAQALTAMPRVSDEFLGFTLLAELGSGTFGRVYLSRQVELADRLVVFKIVPPLFGESRTVDQLQHAHIVPIYSVHQTNAFQPVCMPFVGRTTLADILPNPELQNGNSVDQPATPSWSLIVGVASVRPSLPGAHTARDRRANRLGFAYDPEILQGIHGCQ